VTGDGGRKWPDVSTPSTRAGNRNRTANGSRSGALHRSATCCNTGEGSGLRRSRT
jgi:hypothetical protein